MKMKNIMIITFLLLAVLTIGAASAADDVASDNITVSDDVDIIANEEDYDPYDHSIEVTEDEQIILDSEDEDYNDEVDIAYISLPKDTTKGSFQIFNGAEVVARSDIASIDEEGSDWYIDEEDDMLYGTIYLKNLELNKISNDNVLTFKFFEINDSELVAIEIFTVSAKVKLTDSYMLLTVIDEQYEDDYVETEYYETNIDMKEGWEETPFVTFTVMDGIDGRIVICLNDTIAFNKTLSQLTEDEENSGEYTLLLSDLNVNKAGTYIIRDYFYDNDGNILYQYDEEDPEILVLSESQATTIGNVTIDFESSTIMNGTESFITISNASDDDVLLIYINNENPIQINLGECDKDENGDYIIGSKKLNMPLVAGEYNFNITYKGKNATGKVNLISNVLIVLEEPLYTGFEDEFIFIYLEEGDITETDNIQGNISITIKDGENTLATFEYDIKNILNSDDDGIAARAIKAGDLDSKLNGTYTVVVRYHDGNEAETKTEGKVNFKQFDPKDYGTQIKDTVKDKNDPVITFTDIPLSYDIIVEIDGKEVMDESYLEDLTEQEGNYSIKFDKLGLTEGTHSINVYLDKNGVERIALASGNIIVDLEENIDPALTITVANIEEGNAATVVITTNSTFTGEVTVQVANTEYKVNVTKGQGSTQITGLKANTYTATALFKSDGIFTDATKTATFTVTAKPAAPSTPAAPATPAKKVIKLTLKKVKVKKSAKKLVLKATLKINGKAPKKGTKIKFTFKGKKYIGKTNKKGVAKVTIKKKVLKKLKVGKKVKYTAKYSTKTVKRTAKVKR